MPTKQGDITLLNDPVAQELLGSTNMAKLAYIWHDGTPRVVPIWFHWNGSEVVFGTPPNAPKVRVLQDAKAALAIDSSTWPYKSLSIRGTVKTETLEGMVPEYAAAAERYFGVEQGQAWVEQVTSMFSHMTRIALQPEWVGILDFQQRFPSAIEAAMSGR